MIPMGQAGSQYLVIPSEAGIQAHPSYSWLHCERTMVSSALDFISEPWYLIKEKKDYLVEINDLDWNKSRWIPQNVTFLGKHIGFKLYT